MRMHARLMHDLLHLHGTDWRCLGGFRQFRGSYARFSSITTRVCPPDPYTIGKRSERRFGPCNNIIYFILNICDALTRGCMNILHTVYNHTVPDLKAASRHIRSPRAQPSVAWGTAGGTPLPYAKHCRPVCCHSRVAFHRKRIY
jgi:hypothetical protein